MSAPSLELPITVTSGQRASVVAILEHFSPVDCRFRALVEFPERSKVEIATTAGGADGVAWSGTISRVTTIGSRKYHHVQLQVTGAERAALLSSIEAFAERERGRSVPSAERQLGLMRANPRVEVSLPVRLMHRDGILSGTIADISVGGMRMTAASELAVGTGAQLSFTVDGRPIDVNGRIVGMQPRRDSFTLHVAFHDVADDVRASLAAFIEPLVRE